MNESLVTQDEVNESPQLEQTRESTTTIDSEEENQNNIFRTFPSSGQPPLEDDHGDQQVETPVVVQTAAGDPPLAAQQNGNLANRLPARSQQRSAVSAPVWQRILVWARTESRLKLLSQTHLHLVNTTIATGIFGATAWFARATFGSDSMNRATKPLDDLFQSDFGNALTVLAILQRLASVSTSQAVSDTLELFQWGLTSRSKGLPLMTLLAMSPTTGPWGALCILLGPLATTRWPSRSWAFVR
jgi:hypothetical protein